MLRSDIFAQVNLISEAPTLQNLRIGLRRRQNGNDIDQANKIPKFKNTERTGRHVVEGTEGTR